MAGWGRESNCSGSTSEVASERARAPECGPRQRSSTLHHCDPSLSTSGILLAGFATLLRGSLTSHGEARSKAWSLPYTHDLVKSTCLPALLLPFGVHCCSRDPRLGTSLRSCFEISSPRTSTLLPSSSAPSFTDLPGACIQGFTFSSTAALPTCEASQAAPAESKARPAARPPGLRG